MKRCRDCELYNDCMNAVISYRPTLCETDGALKLSPVEVSVIDYIKKHGAVLAAQIRDDLQLGDYGWNKACSTLRQNGLIVYEHVAGSRGYKVTDSDLLQQVL